MDVNLLIKGFTAGLIVAIPVGPVGLLCTQRILSGGRIHGIVSGIGAAMADVIYSLVVVSGLTIVSDFLVQHALWFRLFSGIFLCLLGLKTFLAKHIQTRPVHDKLRHFNNFSSTLLLTLSNPMSILIIAGVFAGLGIVGSGTSSGVVLQLVGGVFWGSMFWWVLLSIVIGVFHKRLTDNTLIQITRAFGGILAAIGVVIIIFAIS